MPRLAAIASGAHVTIAIQRMRPNDAGALTQIMHLAVHEGACADYTPDQLAAWSPCPMDPGTFLSRLADGRAVWVAFGANAQPCGFVELTQRGHIDLFYCHPAGAGTGAALFAALEQEARALGLSRLTVHASEGARRFFLRAGFACHGGRMVQRGEVRFHNYAMSRRLGSDATLS